MLAEKKLTAQIILKININTVVRDAKKIEDEVIRFYSALFNGYHGADLSINDVPFSPDSSKMRDFLEHLPSLSSDLSDRMHTNISRSELDYVMKGCSNNKAPGLDGLTYEFYRATWHIIGDTFLEILQCQLSRLKLIDSNKMGATRLIPKVTGTPQVDELRPLTLLNCDYRILSKVLVQRLKPTLPFIIKSGQLCTIEKKNILFGINNILSSAVYANKENRGVCLMSLDFFKAYDRVLFLAVGYEAHGNKSGLL